VPSRGVEVHEIISTRRDEVPQGEPSQGITMVADTQCTRGQPTVGQAVIEETCRISGDY
jgi:hypothetical protein